MQFHSGGVHPVAVGCLREVDKETKKSVKKCCAGLAARKEHNVSISPEDLQSDRASPRNLILRQFRTAVGCMATKVFIDEKLRRTMYIRNSAQAARQAAGNSSRRYTAYNRTVPGWYRNAANSQTYSDFYAFNTQYDAFNDEDW